VHAHPHSTLRHCLPIQGLCGLPGGIQLQLGQGETALKNPSAAQTPAATRLGVAMLRVPQRAAAGPWALVWDNAGMEMWVGAPLGWLQGVQRTLSLRGIFGNLCS